MKFKAYAAEQAGGTLKAFEYSPGELKRSQIQIKIEACGLCHSDLSVWRNEWGMSIGALRPRGRLHVVGAVLEPIPVSVFSLLTGQKSVSSSPLGSPATVRHMLDFSGRHGIAPKIETMPMAKVNEALAKLEREKPAHRLVLLAS